ncbi:MAG: response regulator [Ornithinimicrobium sp.]
MDAVIGAGRRPTVLLALLVVVVTLIAAWLTWFSTDRSQRVQHWSEVVQEMQVDVFRSHLALAEWLAGDEAVDLQADVVGPVETVAERCRVLQDGGRTSGVDVEPLPALASGAEFGALCAELDEFRALTEARVQDDSAARQEGTQGDETFDEAFDIAMQDLDGLDDLVNASRRADEVTTQQVGYGIVLALAVLLVGILLAGRQYGRNIAELARRNQVVLDAAGDAIYGVNSDGVGVFANPAAARLIRREPTALARMNVHAVLHGDDDERSGHTASHCPLMQTVQGQTATMSSQDVFWRLDGSSYPAEYTASPVWDDPNTKGVIVFRDISERRAVETMKDEFVSMVSHELRTPLTSIHGSLGLLSGGALGEMPPSAQRMLEIATTNTDRLVRLINDILDIERMDSGAVGMEREVVDAAKLVEQAVSSLHAMAAQAGVEVAVQAEPVTVWADPDRIIQVLVNLVSNAVKFSPEGSTVWVTVALQGHDALLTVRDEGRGIPADKLDTIFGRFQQVDASDSRDKGGTGLGLAISESIVAQHEGRIWVESTEGVGSTFLVRIPTVRELQQPVDELPTVSRVEPSTRPNHLLRRPTVLVVDDDPSVLEVVCAILEGRDYRAIPASSGEEALARAAAQPPDAVVLDLIMPGTDGWEVLGAMRSDPATADVPVIILSILSEREGLPTPASYNGWVPKPFDAQSLATVLERAMAGGTNQLRALVIEDDDDLADVLTTTFTWNGVDARHVSTAAAARSLVPEMKPDLIVLDLRLPDGDGVELLHTLRAAGHLGGVPVVVYTGFDIGPEDRNQLNQDGAIIFTKTLVSPEEFEQRLLQLVGALVLPHSS